MLRIIVEIVPGGVGRPRELARAELGNVSDLADRSDYVVIAREGANPVADTPPWESRGRISDFNRRQSVWKLVQAASSFAARAAQEAGKQ